MEDAEQVDTHEEKKLDTIVQKLRAHTFEVEHNGNVFSFSAMKKDNIEEQKEKDLQALAEWFSDPKFKQFQKIPPDFSAHKLYEYASLAPDTVYYRIKNGSNMIGYYALKAINITDMSFVAAFAKWYKAGFEGQGYAKKLLIDAFNNSAQFGFKKVYADTHISNSPMVRILNNSMNFRETKDNYRFYESEIPVKVRGNTPINETLLQA